MNVFMLMHNAVRRIFILTLDKYHNFCYDTFIEQTDTQTGDNKMNNKITHIFISIGSLPEWYEEEQLDSVFEQSIEDNWRKAYPTAEFTIEYNYQTDNAVVTAFNEDGDVVFERNNHDVGCAFDYAKSHLEEIN